MGIFSSKPKGTIEQLKLIGRLDATYEALESEIKASEGFRQALVEKTSEIYISTQKPITSWSVLDEVCERCKIELTILFSIRYSCDHLINLTGYLRMHGFMKDAQKLAVRLDELKISIESYMAKLLDPMVPVDQDDPSMLGVYYSFEIIKKDFDFSNNMSEKYTELDKAIMSHFGIKN